MKITVQFEAQLREVAGIGSTQIDLSEGANLLDGLKKTVDDGPDALAERVLGNDGSLQPSVMVFVNDQPVIGAAAGSLQLNEGDVILLLPPISGG